MPTTSEFTTVPLFAGNLETAYGAPDTNMCSNFINVGNADIITFMVDGLTVGSETDIQFKLAVPGADLTEVADLLNFDDNQDGFLPEVDISLALTTKPVFSFNVQGLKWVCLLGKGTVGSEATVTSLKALVQTRDNNKPVIGVSATVP